MKVWLPVKGTNSFAVRFLTRNGWVASLDECVELCRQLNAKQAEAAAAKLAEATARIEHRAAEIAAIEQAGLECTLAPLRTPDSCIWQEWGQVAIGHLSCWPDLPADGRVWVEAFPYQDREPDLDESEQDDDGLEGPRVVVFDEDGEWLQLNLMSCWLPGDRLRDITAAATGRERYEQWKSHRRAAAAEESQPYSHRLQEIDAVFAAGLQPSFDPLPAPEQQLPLSYDEWLQTMPCGGRSNYVELIRVHP